jgi:Protein of unknown function (DUF2934)
MEFKTIAEDQIRGRAYQLYLEHGRQAGHDRDDWQQAEYELLQLPVRQIDKLPPPKSKKSFRKSLVSLVRTAMLARSQDTTASQAMRGTSTP